MAIKQRSKRDCGCTEDRQIHPAAVRDHLDECAKAEYHAGEGRDITCDPCEAVFVRMSEQKQRGTGEIEDTFDRWEINVGETEIMLGSCASTDSLESAFLVEEDSEALRAELAVLINKDDEVK